MKKLLLVLALSISAFAQSQPTPGVITPIYPSRLLTWGDLLWGTDLSRTNLTQPITSSSTALPVQSTTGFLAPTVVTINGEIIRICNITAQTLYVCPGGRGFTSLASTHQQGELVERLYTAYDTNRVKSELIGITTTLGPNLMNVALAHHTHALTDLTGTLLASQLGSGIDATKIGNGDITTTQWEYLGGLTSNIQAQLNTIVANSTVSLAVTPPLTRTVAGSVVTLAVNQSTNTVDGYLSAGDHIVFANKLTSPLSVKGDLLTFSSGTHVRHPVGSDGQILVADSAQADGLSWKNILTGSPMAVALSVGNTVITVGPSNSSTQISCSANTYTVSGSTTVTLQAGLGTGSVFIWYDCATHGYKAGGIATDPTKIQCTVNCTAVGSISTVGNSVFLFGFTVASSVVTTTTNLQPQLAGIWAARGNNLTLSYSTSGSVGALVYDWDPTSTLSHTGPATFATLTVTTLNGTTFNPTVLNSGTENAGVLNVAGLATLSAGLNLAGNLLSGGTAKISGFTSINMGLTGGGLTEFNSNINGFGPYSYLANGFGHNWTYDSTSGNVVLKWFPSNSSGSGASATSGGNMVTFTTSGQATFPAVQVQSGGLTMVSSNITATGAGSSNNFPFINGFNGVYLEPSVAQSSYLGGNVVWDTVHSRLNYLENGYAQAWKFDSNIGVASLYVFSNNSSGIGTSAASTGTLAIQAAANGAVTIPILQATTNVAIGTVVSPTYSLQLSADSAGKPSTSSWTVTSDRRTKTNIRPFTDGLDVLRKINPKQYEFNGLAQTPLGVHGIGVIAQDVLPLMPYTVGTFKSKLNPTDKQATDVFNFNASALAYVAVNSIKELDKQTLRPVKGRRGLEVCSEGVRSQARVVQDNKHGDSVVMCTRDSDGKYRWSELSLYWDPQSDYGDLVIF